MEDNKELQGLVLEIAKQNILLTQTIGQLGQRIDAISQAMAQQNTQLNQRIDALAQRMDSAIAQTQQQLQQSIQQTQQYQIEIVKMFGQIHSALEKLPDAVKEQIGFQAKVK
jgi:DNA anti-recombination protein RmuC